MAGAQASQLVRRGLAEDEAVQVQDIHHRHQIWDRASAKSMPGMAAPLAMGTEGRTYLRMRVGTGFCR
jgi:hypothetical protein